MKEVGDYLKKTPLAAGILAMLIGLGAIKLVHTEGMTAMGFHRIVLAFAMSVFVYLISGEKAFEKSSFKTMGYTVKMLLAFVIFSIAIGSLPIILYAGMKMPVYGDWPLNLLATMAFCIGVGLFEELLFRAVLNDMIICQFRKCKHIFLIAAIISSFIFGYVHVMSEDMTNPDLILPIVMKTISTGMMGFALTMLYWKTRNLIGLALIHCLYDFFPLCSSAVFDGSQGLGSYAASSNGGGTPVVWYVIQIIFEAVLILVLWKKVVKTLDFEKMRQEW